MNSAISKGGGGARARGAKHLLQPMTVAAGEEVGSLRHIHTITRDWHAAGWLVPFLVWKDLHHVGRAAGCRLPRMWLHGGTDTAGDAVVVVEEQASGDMPAIVFL